MSKSTSQMILSSPVTHIDWISQHGEKIGHGPKSVKYILDRCKQVGWTRLYWRCLDGGLACYRSKLRDGEEKGYVPDNYHAWSSPGKPLPDMFSPYKKFDCLAEAVDYGHKIGLEIHAWVSINEEDHGWGLQSRFTQAHPEYRWVRRNYCPYNSQISFAFPEVREYQLETVREILQYDVDGIFFDWIRTGDVRNNPQTTPDGTADYGYEIPLVEGFKKKYKIDPRTIPNNDLRWVKFRCEPQTIFMREAHKLIRKTKGKQFPISMMSHHPWGIRGVDGPINGCLHGQLIDIQTWAKERLIDEVVVAGYYRKGGTPEKALKYIKEQVGNRCKIWMYWWVPGSMEDFLKSLKTARKCGATQILFWESDYVENRVEFQKAMGEWLKTAGG